VATVTKLKQKWIDNAWGWFFVLPTFAGLLILNIIPVFQTVWQSFYKVGDFGRGNTFVGITHYVQLIKDFQIWQALLNTLIYAVVEVPFSIAIGFIFAVILNQGIKGQGFFRTIFFLPMVVAPAAVAMVWRYLLSTNFGLINHILKFIGMRPVGWISDPSLAIFSLAVTGVWGSFGFVTILYLAGLQEIPQDYYEAAEIEGAGSIRKHLYITIPMISPVTFFISVTRTIGALQIFDSIFVILGRHSPVLPRTQSLVYLFYRYSFIENNRGYGAAIIILLLLVIMFITVIQNFTQKRLVHYG
jgi:multiple sugar transport system permease protein